jgi:hypothetical protein
MMSSSRVFVFLLCLLCCCGYRSRYSRGYTHKTSSFSIASTTAASQYRIEKEKTQQRLREESIQRRYHDHLELISEGNDDEIKKLGSLEHWMSFAGDSSMTISPNGYGAIQNKVKESLLNETYRVNVGGKLHERGFASVSDDHLEYAKHNINITSIALTMDKLVSHGYPAVFIFLFDQAWYLCLHLFNLMQPVLNDEEAVLEASMYAWSLQRQSKAAEKVGSNFGVPHRDITYNNCHSADGSPDILSLWIPLTDVSTENGCMYVVPRECDPQFSIDNTAKDQDPFSHRFNYAAITPLAPLNPGTVLIWHPNLIHWGGSCSFSSALAPRKSIAMAFRVRNDKRESTEKEIHRYGRAPFKRDELLNGGPSYKDRLRMISKSLILYNVWYPTYEGFDIDTLIKQ